MPLEVRIKISCHLSIIFVFTYPLGLRRREASALKTLDSYLHGRQGFMSPMCFLGRIAQGWASGVPAHKEIGFVSIRKGPGWDFLPASVPQIATVIIKASQYVPHTCNSSINLCLFYRPENPNLTVSAVMPVLAFPSAVSITASLLNNWVGTHAQLCWDLVSSKDSNWVPQR